MFTTFVEIEAGRAHIDDMHARAAEAGREVGVFTTCHVVCRDSQAEADDYYEHYAVTMADTESLDFYWSERKILALARPGGVHAHRKRFAAGAGTYPLVGTPKKIAEEMVRMAEVGFSGTTVSFVDFKGELPHFIATVLPLLREAGLREGS